MKNTILIIALSLLVAAQARFDAAERAYVRTIAANQAVVVRAVNEQYAGIADIVGFVAAELPDQLGEYASRNPSK